MTDLYIYIYVTYVLLCVSISCIKRAQPSSITGALCNQEVCYFPSGSLVSSRLVEMLDVFLMLKLNQ